MSLAIWACSSDNTNDSSSEAALPNLEEVQAAYESDPSDANAKALINALQASIAATEDGERAASLAQKAGQIALDHKQVLPAVNILTSALKNHFGASASADNVLSLASAYEQMNQGDIANTLYQTFAEAFPNNTKTADIQSKIVELPSLSVRMDTLHASVYNDSLQQLDYKKAQDYINSSELHSTILSTSENSPIYIQKAAEIARALRNYTKALDLYEEVLAKYPDSKQAEQALFLSAFTLDNDMKKLDEAKQKYEAFLEKYPDSDFADDTAFLLENLGKDEEEIIQQLQEQ